MLQREIASRIPESAGPASPVVVSSGRNAAEFDGGTPGRMLLDQGRDGGGRVLSA